MARGVAVLAVLALVGCTIEVGPPPESDPPLVPESAKTPPPPPQPTEPQAWSRDLDLDSDPTAIGRGQLTEGLVASDTQGQYSEQRLTFLSAFEEEEKVSEAERLRQKARERAEAAGQPPPPQVSAAPVAEVSAESLDQPGEDMAAKRQSRLPPPPKFPPLPSETASPETASADVASETEATAQPAAESANDTEVTEVAAADPAMSAGTATPNPPPQQSWEQRNSRLPAPPKFPPLPEESTAGASGESAGGAAAGGTQLAATEGGRAQSEPPAMREAVAEAPASAAAAPTGADAQATAASFAAEAWDAPSGTILVQVSAVPDAAKVAAEWQRLQARFPEVLRPLRLVVEQATVGERTAFYRVQAGGFGSEAGAAAACDALISAGQSCFVMVR